MPLTLVGRAIAIGRKAGAVWAMTRLDAAARRGSISQEESLHNTVKWLMRAQDATADDGVSYGYSLYEGWTVSYPETTGYILQSFLWYHEAFGGAEVLERARRMAHWEVDIQMRDGSTPGRYGTATPVPVAFNTGQVLLGWAEYLRRHDDSRVRAAAAKAGRWLVQCMRDTPYFADGVSPEAEHGDLSYNSMVSWGLAELADVLSDEHLAAAAQRSARHYAELVDDAGWPFRSGFSDADSVFPLTHTLGYTVQGLLETGRLLGDKLLVDVAKRILVAARAAIDPMSGFLPGRVRAGWSGGARWACLTGSSQFAYSYLRLVSMGHGEPACMNLATNLVNSVVGTQVTDARKHPALAYGVRGSYPFRFRSYAAVTLPNWAAKFLVDALILLRRLQRLDGNPRSIHRRQPTTETPVRPPTLLRS